MFLLLIHRDSWELLPVEGDERKSGDETRIDLRASKRGSGELLERRRLC
jgi:hypothetical protein